MSDGFVAPQAQDLGFDSLQPFFYPYEEDFYGGCRDTVSPGVDIWEKFELPLSPTWAWPGAGEPPDWASELLLLPPPESEPSGTLGPAPSAWGQSNLSDFLLQDCMWSGFSAMEKLEELVTQKLSAGPQRVPANAGVASVSSSELPPRLAALWNSNAESVDGPVAFPFPVNKRGSSAAAAGTGDMSGAFPEAAGQQQPCEPGSPFHAENTPDLSCSEDDTWLYTNDEDEEGIDVMAKECSVMSASSPKAVSTFTITILPKNAMAATATTSAAATTDIMAHMKKLTLESIQQHHNYAAPAPPMKDLPPQKAKANPWPPCPTKKTLAQGKAKSLTPQDSDSEDSKRRHNHNNLERQRRKDIKSSLATLRDHIPRLAKNNKTSKMVILESAVEYIHSLQDEEKKLLVMKKKLQARHAQLLKNLEHLRTC